MSPARRLRSLSLNRDIVRPRAGPGKQLSKAVRPATREAASTGRGPIPARAAGPVIRNLGLLCLRIKGMQRPDEKVPGPARESICMIEQLGASRGTSESKKGSETQ